MQIYGLQKLTLLDYPGKVACTLFAGGCGFRCPFCHNASLAQGLGAPMPEEEIFSFLERRQGLMEGVCISGGEPTLSAGLEGFIERVRALGYAVKLDTNGERPEVLARLIEGGLVDYVAMDVKNALAKYPLTVGVPGLDTAGVERSAELLLKGGLPYEFRTTVVKELHMPDDIRAIGGLICGAERYFLQPFKDSGSILGEGMSRHSDEELEELLSAAREYVPRARIRG